MFLSKIPLFEDETFHTQWSGQILQSPKNLLLPISVGIAPFFAWISAYISIFTSDQIIAGQITSIVSGAVLMFFLDKFLIKIKILPKPLILLLFTFLPILIVYNSMAILDSLMVLLAFMSFYFLWEYLNEGKDKAIYFYFISLFLVLITKQIAALVIPSIIAGTLVYERRLNEKFFRILLASFLAFLVFIVIFLPFRKESTSIIANFVFIPNNLGSFINHLKSNIFLTINWLLAYYPKLLLTLAIIGTAISLRINRKDFQLMNIIFFSFSFFLIATANIYFPRHTLFLAPIILIYAAICLNYFNKISPNLFFIISVFVVMETLILSAKLFINPKSSNVLAKEDEFQFYEDWTSGLALPDIAKYLDRQASLSEHILIITDNSSTLYFFGLPLYLRQDNYSIKRSDKFESLDQLASLSTPTYIVVNRPLALEMNSLKYEDKIEYNISSRHTVVVFKISGFPKLKEP